MRKLKILKGFKRKAGGQFGTRRHSCLDCKDKSLSNLEWKAHLRRIQTKKNTAFTREKREKQRELLKLALMICKKHPNSVAEKMRNEYLKQYNRYYRYFTLDYE